MSKPSQHPAAQASPSGAALRLVAWELTRSCNLNCIHCRASADCGPYPGELPPSKALRLLEEIREVGRPIIILTGGEPLLRADLFDLAARGTELGLRMVMATNGTLINRQVLSSIKQSGIRRVSVSIDGPDAATHDAFRKVPGAFRRAVEGCRQLREAGVEFQVNTTVTRHNAHLVEDLLKLAVDLGAAAHHIFLLVPTGRARDMVNQEIDALAYEKLLRWFYWMRNRVPLHLKATCAPHYYRILRQEASKRGEEVNFKTYGLDAVTRGCLGGISFCFISYRGLVQPCGYLELESGDVTKESFPRIWHNSPVFAKLRDFSAYKGKCGACEFLPHCGGCRARAYEATGDFLAEEPLCLYRAHQARAAS